jgi:hypothetical protein
MMSSSEATRTVKPFAISSDVAPRRAAIKVAGTSRRRKREVYLAKVGDEIQHGRE